MCRRPNIFPVSSWMWKISRAGRRYRLGYRAHGFRSLRPREDPLFGPAPRRRLENPLVQGHRPETPHRPQHAFPRHVLPGKPRQGTHSGARFRRGKPDGGGVKGQISVTARQGRPFSGHRGRVRGACAANEGTQDINESLSRTDRSWIKGIVLGLHRWYTFL